MCFGIIACGLTIHSFICVRNHKRTSNLNKGVEKGIAFNPLLHTENLFVSYRTYKGSLTAVEDANLLIENQKIYALVGESGCGKSTLGLALSRLLPENQVNYSGKIVYKGVDLLAVTEDDVEQYRGTGIATVFQEPMTSLNPVYRIGDQIGEALDVRERRTSLYDTAATRISRPGPTARLFSLRSPLRSRGRYGQSLEEIHRLLEKVKIPNPERVASMYPRELSGGMKQRVMIAMAVAEKPSLLVADEPTTALDVTTQVQILNLIKSLNLEYSMAVLLITHNLGVVRAIADYVWVMYASKIVEEAPAAELFQNPLHPYTVGLIASFPRGRKDNTKLKTIPGYVPPLGRYPKGCRFHTRCERVFERCDKEIPGLIEVSKNHRVACFLYE
jgi:peptide/nickel transport system ATP-binding protein